MKTLRPLLCLMLMTVITGCATCRPQSAALASSSSGQEKSEHPFWEWLGEQAVQNLLNWAIFR